MKEDILLVGFPCRLVTGGDEKCVHVAQVVELCVIL